MVQLFAVEVPYKTTYRFLVPEYDLPIIRALWRIKLLDVPGNSGISVTPTGRIEPRSLHDESERLKREYATASDENDTMPVHQLIYPNQDALKVAWLKAVESGTALWERQQAEIREAEEAAAAAERASIEAEERAQDEALRAAVRERVDEVLGEEVPAGAGGGDPEPAGGGGRKGRR